MKDLERLDLPSASSFEMDALCPGRRQLIDSLAGNVIDITDELAERGTRIHKALEKRDPSELDEDDTQIYDTGIKNEERIVADWCQQFNLFQVEEKQAEERLWVHWPETATPAASAQLDRHYICREDNCIRVLAVDHKTLWAKSLTPAERNYQARIQAVVAAQEYDANHVRVAFNKAMFGKSDTVDYDESNLVRAKEAILQSIWETQQPGAKRTAGSHCDRCVGKSICREAAAWALLPSVVNQKINVTSPKDIAFLVEQMTNEDLSLVHRRAGVIVKILESVKARLKTLSDEDLTAVGLTKVPGRRLDPIVKTKEAFDFLRSKYNISEAELWASLSFGKGELVDALRRDQGWAKKVADGFVRGQLQPFIEEKRAQESIDTL